METPIPKAEERAAVERAVLLDLSSVLENAPYILEQQERDLDGISFGNSDGNSTSCSCEVKRVGVGYSGSGLSLGQSQSSSNSGCQSNHGCKATSVNRDRIEYFRPGQGMSPSPSHLSGMSGTYHYADMHDTNREFGRHH